MKDAKKNGPKKASKRNENSKTLSKEHRKQEKRRQKRGQKISIEIGLYNKVEQMYHFNNSYQFRSEKTKKTTLKVMFLYIEMIIKSE